MNDINHFIGRKFEILFSRPIRPEDELRIRRLADSFGGAQSEPFMCELIHKYYTECMIRSEIWQVLGEAQRYADRKDSERSAQLSRVSVRLANDAQTQFTIYFLFFVMGFLAALGFVALMTPHFFH